MTKWKDLTKKERKHVTEMGAPTLREFKHLADRQSDLRQRDPEGKFEPCWDCRAIAKKLELPV